MERGHKLTDAQWKALDELRFATPSRDVFRNCLIIMMSHSGDTIASVADRLGCGTDTVTRIRRLYRNGGIEALHPIKPPGRPSRATPEYLAALRAALLVNPTTLGYGFSTWSVKRLGAHLAKTTGVRFGVDQLNRLMRREEFSFQRPKHTLKGKRDEAAYEKSREELMALKKKALRKNAAEALVFQDEMEIHRNPTLTRMWSPVGQQPEIPTPGKNEKRVVYGGVDYATGKIVHTMAATKSGEHFLNFLLMLVAVYKGRKVRMVCDNGRFHVTKKVLAWLALNSDKIEIYWLPPYCPSLNLIERLWGHLKRTILANLLFTTMDDLTGAFRRGVRNVNGRRSKMPFVFKHDDILRKKAA